VLAAVGAVFALAALIFDYEEKASSIDASLASVCRVNLAFFGLCVGCLVALIVVVTTCALNALRLPKAGE
jgi:ABC-type Mn2+/Zn2+ transport system permease subunit